MIVGMLMIRLFESVGLVHSPSDMSIRNTCTRYLLWLFPAGVGCIMAGARTAPRYRLATACVVAIVWSLLTDWVHRWGAYTVIPTTVTTICGVAFVFFAERSQDRSESLPPQD